MLRYVDGIDARLMKETPDACGEPVNVLNIFRSLAIDMVTSYLFEKSYQGIEEPILSATGFLNRFFASNSFFYLPNSIFQVAGLDRKKFYTLKSLALVEKFAADIVDRVATQENVNGATFQARLLSAGISWKETIANCIDVMFAGTDASATTLFVICCLKSERKSVG